MIMERMGSAVTTPYQPLTDSGAEGGSVVLWMVLQARIQHLINYN